MDKEKVGERIKSIRINGNWTLEEFGELVFEATKGNVNQWEKGSYLPSPKRLERIALLGKVSSNWIKYGDVRAYLKEIFPMNITNKFTGKFYIDLEKQVEKRNIDLGDMYELIITAVEIMPELATDEKFNEVYNKPEVMIKRKEKFLKVYEVEDRMSYRTHFLPMLDKFFKEDDAAIIYNKRFNDQAIITLFDTLTRMNKEIKYQYVELLILINRIITDNILETDNSYIAEFAIKGGYTKLIDLEKLENRNIKNVTKDYKELKKKIVLLLDEMFKQNLDKNFND